MINVFSAARSAISVVTTPIAVTIKRSGGYTTNADGSRVPVYTTLTGVTADIQPMTLDELHQIDGLNLGGEKTAIYIHGEMRGTIRADQSGGDVVEFPNGDKWLVVLVLESWSTWVKVAAVRQL